MTKKFTKTQMFQELSIKLAIIEAKQDKILELLHNMAEQTPKTPTLLWPDKQYSNPEKYEIYTPQGDISHVLSSGCLSDSGVAQVWYNTEIKLSKVGDDVEE